MIKNLEDQILALTETFFLESKGSHDWEHTLRVRDLCLHIGKKEGADMKIIVIAAILHDIGRSHQDQSEGTICHAEKGAEISRDLLSKLEVDKETTEKIIHCIETHRFRGNKIPKSKEAKILYDADKLDSIGAIGIGRAFLFSGEIGAKLHNRDIDIEKTEPYTREDTAYREYALKLKAVKGKMLTKEGKYLAKNRHDFMTEFFERFDKEVKGEL